MGKHDGTNKKYESKNNSRQKRNFIFVNEECD